jgi:hypothetical protein
MWKITNRVLLIKISSDIPALLKAGNEIDPVDSNALLTKAGRALTKHNSVSRPGSVFTATFGNQSQINAQADKILSDILNDPNKSVKFQPGGEVFDITSSKYGNGGVRFFSDGSMKTFIEPNI